MFTWIDGNTYHGVATLYANNITLNNVASEPFKDIRWCCIGIDETALKVAIRPVTKREVDLNLVPLKQLHKVSAGKGYTRISNKAIMDRISSMIQKQCSGLKFNTIYDDNEKLLIIDLCDSV